MSVEHRSSLLDRLTDQINRLQVIAYHHSVQACSGTSPAPGANAGHDRSSLLLTYARDEALEGNRKKKQGQTCGSVLRRRLGQREGERRVMEERGKCSRGFHPKTWSGFTDAILTFLGNHANRYP